MKFWKRFGGYMPILATIVVVGCVGTALKGYAAPVYEVEQPENIQSTEADAKEKKQETRRKLLQQQREEMQKLRQLERDGSIDFSQLPVLEPRLREILLKWVSDAMEAVDFSARTDDGRAYVLERSPGNEKRRGGLHEKDFLRN